MSPPNIYNPQEKKNIKRINKYIMSKKKKKKT